ncbi:GGDEF domain-containing protein [Saccharopolyspora mangrovi]|uniref:GGDEF domain-containing protein n=1 Tax=Saccharopolyspora mangrovi TaxID=3082379 RepID=A0ABU6AFU4_9PSEU|nr:GGDEF domain-containing protein [Saccharopolyspora sp. S2-29]MEB3370200.1 GGDEF domain-containing protein [Saccharopolyspora sp. S2-29]
MIRNGFAGQDPHSGRGDVPQPPTPRSREELANGTGMAELHESIARLLASRGQWRQAYHHLRSALDMMSSDKPAVPEQLRSEVELLRREHAKAREESLRDSLTASYNRRYLDERLADLVAENGMTGEGLAVALIDLDWFKLVNDSYGHLFGDRVLQRVVDLLQEALPDGAFCARYGGEEFVLVLPHILPNSAVQVCEAARQRVEHFRWEGMAPGLGVTISIGVAHEQGVGGHVSGEQQLISSDALLYAAKRAGRNAVAYRRGAEVRLAGAAAGRVTETGRKAAGY